MVLGVRTKISLRPITAISTQLPPTQNVVPGLVPAGRAASRSSRQAPEALQGFARGWTEPAQPDGSRNGPRWKLVGNAVTVSVSEWLGRRLAEPGEPILEGRPFDKRRWPIAARGDHGRHGIPLSMWPVREPTLHLLDVLDLDRAVPLSP